jgi:hypothetical protein
MHLAVCNNIMTGRAKRYAVGVLIPQGWIVCPPFDMVYVNILTSSSTARHFASATISFSDSFSPLFVKRIIKISFTHVTPVGF